MRDLIINASSILHFYRANAKLYNIPSLFSKRSAGIGYGNKYNFP